MILKNPMLCGVCSATPLRSPMQQYSKPPIFCSCFSANMFEIPVLLCVRCNDSEVCSVQPLFGQVPFKNPDGRFHAVRSAPDAVPAARSMQGYEVCNLHWDSCIHRRCLLQLLLSWRGHLEENPWHVRINCSLVSDAQNDSDVEIQGPDFPFLVCPPRARVNSATNGIGIACERRSPNAQQCSGWTLHGPVLWVQHSVLC